MTKEEINAKAKDIYESNGRDAKETARVLFDFGRDDAGVAKALRDGLGISDAGIAKALRDGLGISDANIAWALCSRYGCDRSDAETAKALRDGLGISDAETAKALRDGLELSDANIAWALCSRYGLGISDAETAKALRDGLELSDADVAKAFRDGIELSAEELCFNTDLASVEMVMEMIRQGVIRKMDTNSLFRWDEEYQIFSIGGSGSVVVADLDFPIVRVEDHACVEIASVKGRAEIRNDAIVSIGRVGGSVHVTDRASCVAKVVAGDANLWAEGTLTVGVAKNLVNRGMNPILVDSKVAELGPEQSHAEKAIAELQNDSESLNQGIK